MIGAINPDDGRTIARFLLVRFGGDDSSPDFRLILAKNVNFDSFDRQNFNPFVHFSSLPFVTVKAAPSNQSTVI